jgi:hypothetical protein
MYRSSESRNTSYSFSSETSCGGAAPTALSRASRRVSASTSSSVVTARGVAPRDIIRVPNVARRSRAVAPPRRSVAHRRAAAWPRAPRAVRVALAATTASARAEIAVVIERVILPSAPRRAVPDRRVDARAGLTTPRAASTSTARDFTKIDRARRRRAVSRARTRARAGNNFDASIGAARALGRGAVDAREDARGAVDES